MDAVEEEGEGRGWERGGCFASDLVRAGFRVGSVVLDDWWVDDGWTESGV